MDGFDGTRLFQPSSRSTAEWIPRQLAFSAPGGYDFSLQKALHGMVLWAEKARSEFLRPRSKKVWADPDDFVMLRSRAVTFLANSVGGYQQLSSFPPTKYALRGRKPSVV